MAYETGAAAGATDLLDKIRAFAAGRGWTVNLWANDGAGKRLHLQKGTLRFNFRSLVDEPAESLPGFPNLTGILMNGSDEYDGAFAWNRQVGRPINTGGYSQYAGLVSLGANIPYHLFGHGDCIYVICEPTAGQFQWMCFGTLEKIGAWTGGAFFTGSADGSVAAAGMPACMFGSLNASSYGYVRAVVDAFDGWLFGQAGNPGPRVQDSIMRGQALLYSAPNTFNTLSPRLPVMVFTTRDGQTFNNDTPFSPIGYLPEFFFVNIKYLAAASQVVDGVNYRVFPFRVKADAYPSGGNTGNLGMAIKE